MGALAGVGCERASSALVTPAELADAKASLAARRRVEFPCDRPVLRGDAMPGPAADDQRAALGLAPTGDGASVVTAVRRAVAHTGACSAFETEPVLFEELSSLTGELTEEVKRLAATSTTEALQAALDGVRFFQDLRRGRVPDNVAAAALSSERQLIEGLVTSRWGGPIRVEPFMAEIDALFASEPDLGASLQGALDTVATVAHTDEFTADAIAVQTLAVAALRERTRAACPEKATAAACHQGLASLAPPSSGTRTAELLRQPFTEKTRLAHRDEVVRAAADDILRAIAPFAASRVPSLMGLTVVRATLQRLVTGCPGSDDLAAPPWTEILAPARLGGSIIVDQHGDSLVFRPPAWSLPPTKSRLAVWALPCGSLRY